MDCRKNKTDGEKEEEFLVQNSAPTLESPSTVAVAGKCEQSEERKSDVKEHDNHLPKGCKWSFQVSDLQNLSSTECIPILQAKMQEIRKRYRLLKAELAAIDRKKHLKKKKELERAAATSSSTPNEMPGECRKQKCGPALMQHQSKHS
ncbi:AT-rich interactive domain-containing protein 4B-like isoform X2 [Taeniopygia guttata]|uniref:AT-rich interactive domain-containing protein 4B-like isoform X2 n=1 Tax=Taeniopygia guttata TaxID=59729 RepID=UPI003BB88A5D